MDYNLEKHVWTDTDFDEMGWHDNQIYKISLSEDLELDIDYILKWNEPDVKGLPFTFWVAPATLVFKNIRSLKFDFNTGLEDCFEIENIERENKNEWTIITGQGDLQFKSDGYEQFIRQEPSFQFRQTIPYTERYGYSLQRVINQANPNIIREDVLTQRKQDFEHYENAKKRQLKRLELEELVKARDNNEMDTKQYLLKKGEIKELLFAYDFFLKGTQFENW